MKIAIMGAMKEEITPLLKYFDQYKTVNYADNLFYEAQINNISLVIAYSKIGKVFSSLTAASMIQKFGCTHLLFSGVAGGINPKLGIGDLIVANKLCQHDVDITAFGHPFGFIPESSIYIETDNILKNLIVSVCKDLQIKVLEGIIATGDQFVANNTKKEFIANTFNADALEMEGSSVAVVCKALQVPFVVLRSISDSANGEANVDFDTFLNTAAENSAKIIINTIKKLGEMK
jgi:adenosylhomocysteine/aminodeoxyfutalosine nucleosidase